MQMEENTEMQYQSQEDDTSPTNVPRSISWRLYVSHFLSTWNSRSFEFGAVLFLASIYPGTLLKLSIYALLASAAAIIFARPIGLAIDRLNRLSVVRFSIVSGRLSVILSCVAFWALDHFHAISEPLASGLFAILILLACLEKAASVLNLVAVERDWVVVIAENESILQKLNARLRRIDLFCKLAGPLFIALVDGASTPIAIFLLLGLNTVSLPIEYFTIAKVYQTYPDLHIRAARTADAVPSRVSIFPQEPRRRRILRQVQALYSNYQFYFTHSACLPSFALSLLYFTVLSFGAQQVTYLIAAGFNSFYIGLVRSLSVVFEISATWIAPRLMRKIGPPRAGIWCLSWQMMWLGASVSFFWGEPRSIVAASGLAAGTILSRIGLWGYDLSAQVIIQTEVRDSQRGEFSSTEASFQNLFELLSYVLTIIWSRPDEFKYPVLISAIAVYSAGFLYGSFLRKRRGHLVHLPCVKTVARIDAELQP